VPLPLCFLLLLVGCGFSSEQSDRSSVSLRLLFPSRDGTHKALEAPQDVAIVVVTVTGPGMEPLFANALVGADRSVHFELAVPNGLQRLFTIAAFDSNGVILFTGDHMVNLTGGSITVTITPKGVSTETTPALLGIAVTPANPSVEVGMKLPFTANGLFSNGTKADLTASSTWSSSDSSVATIDASGMATGVAEGTTTIMAAIGAITGTTTLTVTDNSSGTTTPPLITRLSLTKGVVGDTLKITGSNFGGTPTPSAVSIGGQTATTTRWTDTEIAAIIPDGSLIGTSTKVAVAVTVGGQQSNVGPSLLLFDHTHGVGGQNGNGNLDKLILDVATKTITVTDVSDPSPSNSTISIVLSGDANTVAGAKGPGLQRIRDFDTSPVLASISIPARDVAISRDGNLLLLTDGTATATRFTNFTETPTSTPITNPNPLPPSSFEPDCIHEVALSSDGNTAAVITQESPDGCFGPFHIYRIDDVKANPKFTDVVSSTEDVVYTDVAISEDGHTVIAGWINRPFGQPPTFGIDRILNSNPGLSILSSQVLATSTMTCTSICTVDVDISADGMTAIVGIAGIDPSGQNNLFKVFQILDADLVSATSREVFQKTILGEEGEPPRTFPFLNLEGVAINSGGSIALVRVNDSQSPSPVIITAFPLFNHPFFVSIFSISFDFDALPTFNTSTPVRNQDQIDLQ